MTVVSALDFKLGARMLRRYPGLSLIGGLALALAIALGALAFELARDRLTPSLPLDEGDRVVRIENFDRLASAPEPHALYDLERWRTDLRGIEQLGAARSVDRNLVLPGQPPRTVPVAEMTPSGFVLTRVPPLRGRPLLDADAVPGAPDVVVIGHDLWQHRLDGDPEVIGRVIQLGATRATVVGIMPEGYGFPRYAQAWLPLRETARAPGEGPPVLVFGRLAPGATYESARAELAVVHARLAAEDSAYRRFLQPRVVPFANTVLPVATSAVMTALGIGVLVVLIGVSANVATLMFARTALRESEIALRTSLGATRGRIVAQLIAESLVLSGIATVVGLLVARGVLQFITYQQVVVRQEPQPFWRSAGLSPETVLWAAGLAVLGAVLIGLLPALKATAADVRGTLARTAAETSGMRFGGVWSVVIVAQVAFSVLCLPVAIGTTQEMLRDGEPPTFRPDQFLSVETQFDEAAGPRREAAYAELERRLLAEPSVAAVTYASALPGTDYRARRLEAQRDSETPTIVRAYADGMVLSSRVAPDFFDVFALPIVAGRALGPADVGARTAVVNQSLARKLGGRPIGARLRDVTASDANGASAAPAPWIEVVGVVRNTGMVTTDSGEADMIYEAARPADLEPGFVALRLRGGGGDLAGRLPALALAVDPALRVYRALPFDEVLWRRALPGAMAYVGVMSVIVLAITLSAAGLFALMAVAVQRRTREIGIRVALGATSRGVLRALFGRAAAQLAGGILLGNLLIVGVRILQAGTGDLLSFVPSMLAISAVMTLVGVAACAVPGRRALRVQPTEAIRGG